MQTFDPIAVYGAVVATIVLLIQLASFVRGSDDLSLTLSSGMVVGPLEGVLGTNHVVQATVVSRGDRPVGVSSLQLKLTRDQVVPFLEPLPTDGSRRLPAVLERGQFSTYWLRQDQLRDMLRASGLRIQGVTAILSDGRRIERGVGASWRSLGSE